MSSMVGEPEGDACQVAGMLVSADLANGRVNFDPDPTNSDGHKVVSMDRNDLGILLRYLTRLHGSM